jgi:hypothetical protein
MGYGRHLRQRGGAAHFRRVVPKDLFERFGRREIVRSIGALPAFERHSQSRRFSVACDEAFAMVRSEPTLTREDIDRLVDVYLGDLANRDREYASWQPRRPIDQAGFRRRTQIGVYSDLARSVADPRRTNARLIDDDVLREVATKAGLSLDPDSLDPILVEDALGEALARFYAQRADELRNEARVGESAPLRRWLRGVLGIAVPQPPTAAHSPSRLLPPSRPGRRDGLGRRRTTVSNTRPLRKRARSLSRRRLTIWEPTSVCRTEPPATSTKSKTWPNNRQKIETRTPSGHSGPVSFTPRCRCAVNGSPRENPSFWGRAAYGYGSSVTFQSADIRRIT